jgi:hypothetical protein
MKLMVVALDYDGTIARDDRMDGSAREAIASLRASGMTVLLVTGRILKDLRQVAGDLHFVDGVVAENGAVVYFPQSDHTTVLAPPVPDAFVAELARRRVDCHSGECVVEASAEDAVRLLEIIREMELPLAPAFNRSRVMILPPSVSKGVGLHTALDMLRLSARNTLAIGDAENDHEMLRLVEVGAAVGWGSPTLQAAADIVIPGTGPAAVAEFLAPLAASRQLPQPARARRRLHLGYAEDGREFSLAVRGRNILVAGDAKSGKSWVAGLLCEQLILHGYCVCVIDPEGDYRTLESLPGVNVLGGEDPPPAPRQLLRALRYPDRSVIIDLSRLPFDEKVDYTRAVLPALNEMRRRTGLPHRIVIDEAHYFLHEEDARQFLDLNANGYIVVTYWASRLPPELLAATEVMIVTCESDPTEVEALWRRCAGCATADAVSWRGMLGHLPIGRAVVLPITEEAGGAIRLFAIGRRFTPHVRHRQKYVDVPVSPARAFVFEAPGDGVPRRAHTLREFVAAVEQFSPLALESYLERGDFSRWIGDVFGDLALAGELQAIERKHPPLTAGDAARAMVAAVRARYDLSEN